MRRVLVMVLAAVALPVGAQTVQKCIDASGLERWKRANDARNAASRSAFQSTPPRASASESRHSRCEAAKQHRDAQLERLGLRRTHADLRRLDAPVHEACK